MQSLSGNLAVPKALRFARLGYRRKREARSRVRLFLPDGRRLLRKRLDKRIDKKRPELAFRGATLQSTEESGGAPRDANLHR